MTPDQILLVRTSWSMIADRADELTTRFYAHLFEIDESAARLFAAVDMAAQRHKLARTLGVVVHALDNLDTFLPAVAALGKRHTHYGVEHHHFESVGEALLRAFADSLGPDFTPAVRAAWSDAYAIISSVMRRALTRRESGIGNRESGIESNGNRERGTGNRTPSGCSPRSMSIRSVFNWE